MAGLSTGKWADGYVRNWLVPLAAERKRLGTRVKILSMGIAGPDVKFLEAIHANGGWPLLDGIAFHPGRGNYTADYIDTSPKHEFWTYLGAIRTVKAAVQRLGPKPIWVTEAYACTQANNDWVDTKRHAAENIVLTFALGLAEGLETVEFYQLHDAVWYNQGGVNPKDREYDFGILHRDGAVKPSLFAYCAIAEALDGATFTGDLSFPDPNLKGHAYTTPRGAMDILWSRADGYTLTVRSKSYAEPEPWLDPWPTKTTVSLPAAGTVTVIDCLGRKTTLSPVDGQVSLVLDGAPRIVYGLRLNH